MALRDAAHLRGHEHVRRLREAPEAEARVVGDRFRARARAATPEEKPEQRTGGEIPAVALERV
jgi:hypothetical protein